MRFTTLPFLIAFMAGLLVLTPLDIYAINGWNHGTERTEPWRSRLRETPVIRRAMAWLNRVKDWCAAFKAGPLVTAVAIAVMVACLAPHLSGVLLAAPVLAMPGASRLKVYRQAAVDLEQELADNEQQANDINAQIHALNKTITKDKRAMTDDERGKLAAWGDQKQTLAELRAALNRQKADNAALLVEAEADNEKQRQAPAVDDPDAKAAAAAAGRVQLGTNHVEDDPKKGFKDHKEFLHSVLEAGQGRKVDPRLIPLRATQGSDEQMGSSDPYGGFLVPHGVAPGILQIQPEDDPIAPLTTKPPMRTPTVSFNARVDKDHTTSVSGGLVVTRHPETVDATPSRMKFEQVTLTANELFGLAYATERIITDSPESFVAILAAGFSDEYNAKAMDERLNGSGAGEPLGVLHANNGCLVSVGKENGQAVDTIVKENIDKMLARVWRPSGAVWLANHDTRPQLKSVVQVVGIGGQPVPYFTSSGGQDYLDGRPLYFTEFCSKLGDVGDLILGNWSQYLEGEYQPMRSDESIHVRFAAGERCFRFYKRNDGQPWWRSALTPKKSAQTLSPFVALAAR